MNIYVGNLSFNTTEDTLRQYFEGIGQVAKVSIITDRETGRPRGFAFIEMPNGSEAREAMKQLDGQDLEGRSLKVSEAKPRDRG